MLTLTEIVGDTDCTENCMFAILALPQHVPLFADIPAKMWSMLWLEYHRHVRKHLQKVAVSKAVVLSKVHHCSCCAI